MEDRNLVICRVITKQKMHTLKKSSMRKNKIPKIKTVSEINWSN